MGSPQRSVLVDPLSDFSLVSLFPRTFNQRDPDPDPRHNDLLEAVSAHLESVMLKNPNTLLEQAKSILDGKIESISVNNLEIVTDEDTVGDLGGVNNANLQGDTENPENPRAVDSIGDVRGVNHEKLQVRRPALGRKKARFALKQKSSQSMETLEPFVDIDKLPDPEEFFLALEKHENAKNELRRQSGKALMDIDQNVPYMTERRRRPGLLSKSASYKHRFSTAPSGDDKAFFSSQEKLSQDLCSPSPSNNSLQTEHTGPKNTVKTRPDDISEELQSCEDKDDDNDEIIEMLQERFKPIEIDKSCLPELNSVLQSEFMTLGESLQDSQDKMSDLQGFVSAIGKATTLGYNNLERSSGHPSTLPRPPKSPYASISSLKAHLFQSRKENDPFSALDIDLSPVRNAASCKDTHDLAARDLENTIKNVNMPNLSSANRIHVESAHATGDNDARETNPNSPVHESEVSKDIQDLAAAKFTSSGNNIGDSMVPDVPSDSTGHMELEDDIVENAERDINPKSTVLEKESDTARTMKTAKDISKTLGVCSDSLVHIESHHSIRRDQRSESAARDKESNVVHTMDIRDFDAENLPLSTEIRKDNSMFSDITLNTTPHVEMDHDITANNIRGGVLEHNTSDVCDGAAKSADEHIEPNGKVPEENVLGSNVEKSNCYKEQSTVNAVENLEKNGRSSNLDELSIASVTGEPDHDRPSSSLARPLKKARKASSKMAEYKSSKAREPAHGHHPAGRRAAAAARKQTRESIECSRRKSLAACGTQWASGLRRSTRIRTRPLEYWKGERQLYGRIHDSLITVVGTKYFSPAKEAGRAGLKVKSYVSDEYKEIVERAALH